MRENDLVVRERVVRNRPNRQYTAKGYFLQTAMRRFPTTGSFSLDPYQPPFKIPTGSYRVFYTQHLSGDDSPMDAEGGLSPVVEIYDPGCQPDGEPGGADSSNPNVPAKRQKGGIRRRPWKEAQAEEQAEAQADTTGSAG